MAECHNHTTVVQLYLQHELKLPEGITIGASSGTSGPQEELGIDATMAFDRRRAQPSVPE